MWDLTITSVYIGEREKQKGVSLLEDARIVRLYLDRDEGAIPATAEKYGGYCKTIAKNILNNEEDAEECVNDTYLSAWNTIPPQIPENFAAFLGKITRNLSLSRHRQNTAYKRGGGEFHLVLDELSELLSGNTDVEKEICTKELTDAVNKFLDTLSPKDRGIFICRYWYADSTKEIAARRSMKEGTVSMTLTRLRRKLRKHLTKEGF